MIVEKMSNTFFVTTVLILISTISTSFAAELPKPKQGEIIVFLLSEEEAQNVCSIENFKPKCYPNGVCYGVNKAILSLLTRIKFNPGAPKDKDEVVEDAFIQAAFPPIEMDISSSNSHNSHKITQPTINGYGSASEFVKAMTVNWPKSINPLIQSIIGLQNVQPANWTDNEEELIPMAPVDQNVNLILESISLGIPVNIGIHHKNLKGHALTIYGYKYNIAKPEEETEFYVYDSNFPEEFKILKFIKPKVGGNKQNIDPYFIYQPWESEFKKKMENTPTDIGITDSKAAENKGNISAGEAKFAINIDLYPKDSLGFKPIVPFVIYKDINEEFKAVRVSDSYSCYSNLDPSSKVTDDIRTYFNSVSNAIKALDRIQSCIKFTENK